LTDSGWPEIAPATLTEQVYRAVRDKILTGEIAPGEFTRERELSTAMKVSRTPLREALTRLASEGLLEKLPHRGFRVPTQAYDRLVEVYPIVSALEVLAGTLAFPNMHKLDIDTLERLNSDLKGALDRGDVEGQMASNMAFHQLISQRSQNERLNEVLDELRSQLSRLERWYYSYPANSRRSILEHRAIIDNLRGGNFAEAVEILRDNMSLTKIALFDQTALGDKKSAPREPAKMVATSGP
jgi:DNA-binding GntR family transcriptional regulator